MMRPDGCHPGRRSFISGGSVRIGSRLTKLHGSLVLLGRTVCHSIKNPALGRRTQLADRIQLFSELRLPLRRQSEVFPLHIERTNLITDRVELLCGKFGAACDRLRTQQPLRARVFFRNMVPGRQAGAQFPTDGDRMVEVPNLICVSIRRLHRSGLRANGKSQQLTGDFI